MRHQVGVSSRSDVTCIGNTIFHQKMHSCWANLHSQRGEQVHEHEIDMPNANVHNVNYIASVGVDSAGVWVGSARVCYRQYESLTLGIMPKARLQCVLVEYRV